MRSPRNLSDAAQTPEPGAMGRAIGVFTKSGGILNTKRAVELGVHPRELYALRDAGKLERLERGLYRLANAKPLGNPDLVTVSHKVPKGVVCLISALAFHRLTTQIPHSVYLAIPANDQTPAMQYPPLRIFWYSRPVYESGIAEVTLDGTQVRIYSAEKTLADCFKFRNQVGLDTVLEALKEYIPRGHPKVDDLVRYSEICRVRRVMRPYLEALL